MKRLYLCLMFLFYVFFFIGCSDSNLVWQKKLYQPQINIINYAIEQEIDNIKKSSINSSYFTIASFNIY